MHPPISSPYLSPSNATKPSAPTTWGQWLYAAACVAAAAGAVYFTFSSTREVIAQLYPGYCMTGSMESINQAIFAPLLCFAPSFLLALAKPRLYGTKPYNVMRFTVVASFAISTTLVIGLMVLHGFRADLG